MPSSSPFPYRSPLPPIPYRHPPLFSINLSRIGGLSSGSIKTSWLTDSHGKWCLGKKGFRVSSWGLPTSAMGWSTAYPNPLLREQTPKAFIGCASPPWPFLAQDVGLGGLICPGFLLSPFLITLWTVSPHNPRPGLPQQEHKPLCPGQGWDGQPLDQPAGREPSCPLWGCLRNSSCLLCPIGVEVPCCPQQARMGPQGLAVCLSCLSLSTGFPQREKAKLCSVWGFQELAMSFPWTKPPGFPRTRPVSQKELLLGGEGAEGSSVLPGASASQGWISPHLGR